MTNKLGTSIKSTRESVCEINEARNQVIKAEETYNKDFLQQIVLIRLSQAVPQSQRALHVDHG